ncbi:MAG: hypothetical protein Q8S15_02000 [Erysipelotrichaceae bacterium]|nr:hypothetical protein [Erysipelotrichaceae bacterium]MDP3304837.1 hypothetical protein [Erysipelotrichaceae bacterium]
MSNLSYLWIAFGRINELEWGITPQEWLQNHWYVRWNNFVLAEPSSTFFVFLLAFVILWLAFRLLRTTNHQRSRFWFGLSMLAWSLSTFSAGVSYQIFSYELKCAGRTVCLWTTPWEIAYLLLYVISVKLLVVAVSYASVQERTRQYYLKYAGLMGLIYFFILLIGILLPNQFLISFELMVLFLVPSYILMFLINLKNVRKSGKSVDRRLIMAWVGMLLITIAYFAFYLSGISVWLWQRGIWFNANDVLHLLLIVWAMYINYKVLHLIEDSD